MRCGAAAMFYLPSALTRAWILHTRLFFLVFVVVVVLNVPIVKLE